MVHFVSGGPGAPDLLALRAAEVMGTRAREETRPLVLTTRDAGFPDAAATTAVFMAGPEPLELQGKLLAAGYAEDTPCVVAHRVSWPDETVTACPLAELADRLGEHDGGPQTLVLVGRGALKPRLSAP